MNPFFSIIVPVYNVAPYLRECLDSVLAQTYPNWECLCVNDGSTDESGLILDEYAKRDPRFRIFHKPNGGVSSARNLALDNTKGEWILFVDSDDLLTYSCLEEVGKYLTDEISWLSFNVKTMCANGTLLDLRRSKGVWALQREAFFSQPIDLDVVWGNCFRRVWLDRIQLRFETKLSVAEDSLFMSLALMFAQKVKHQGDILGYFYRLPDGRGSLMERAAEKYWDCRMMCLATLLRLQSTNNPIWHRLCGEWGYTIYLFALTSKWSIGRQFQRLYANEYVKFTEVRVLQLSRRHRFALWYWMMPQKGWILFGCWALMRFAILMRLHLKHMFGFK